MDKPALPIYLVVHFSYGDVTFPLQGRSYWTVGRSQDNDLVIRDNCISRNHAILQATEEDTFLLIDLGSRNGTFVNGRRVSVPIAIQDQDKITFGKTEAQFYSDQNGTPSGLLRNPAEWDTQTNVLHERRLITVLVADMRNFTGMAQQVEEELLSMLIGNWFRQAGHILREAGSWVDKYIGDAVMAIWFHGYNEATPAEIIQILHAVNRLQAMTAKLNQKYELPFPLRIGTGINTGYAMVGNTGSGDHPDYTAIGDTVNAAFRLESATKQAHFDLAMSEKTFSYLQDLPQWSATVQQHTIELKGYTNPITIYGLPFATLGTLLDHTSLEDTTPASEGP
ncbi:adenylate cyclase [Synechocystis sp. PCC 6803]|uniref:Adenylate cyclase n=1 Tax=Synechocystis sp. (strain ATCC 27184 / PCC 6803 / Kazusa) TaxID=1111708 RepID=P73823_SYNY3|nr:MULTISPECIES: adenylate/guanylate cyclase domain-containing protein [unclassified Synechocystis]MBD2618508.1 adenylate/guanylate cyclase domain-containing protein [Synechocystis sp. FACHB-898]MBD2637898.1 adenylate/guanylate cyclase domain-containing protein [Synechocystis sp. FACHB-908]MBD2660983.1 adenylate/guanylate cyclase domain-containing protein [Synechocystis sp. FACHB-929]BAM51633.1 adenylate cyclase [Synechocystis sp. PCC 6803] [Bacillus subtilis BEST7613]AGF51568.1 adenylate cycl